MSKVTVVGSINMDLVVQVNEMPKIGETVMGRDYQQHFGGKGANQAVAAARLGAEVSMIGCVGNDAFGTAMYENLKKEGIDVSGIRISEDVSSGKALIIVEKGNNAIVVDGAANLTLTPEDIRQNEDIIKNSDCVLLQLEIPIQTVIEAARIAKENGVTVILNPAPAALVPDELLSLVDIFLPNETECSFYAGVDVEDENMAGYAIHMLLNRGIKSVVVTMGSKGAAYNIGDEIYQAESRKVDAVDSTAAGDSFIGALASQLGDGKSLEEAVKFACVVGSIVVTRHGAQPSIPTLSEVRQYLS